MYWIPCLNNLWFNEEKTATKIIKYSYLEHCLNEMDGLKIKIFWSDIPSQQNSGWHNSLLPLAKPTLINTESKASTYPTHCIKQGYLLIQSAAISKSRYTYLWPNQTKKALLPPSISIALDVKPSFTNIAKAAKALWSSALRKGSHKISPQTPAPARVASPCLLEIL